MPLLWNWSPGRSWDILESVWISQIVSAAHWAIQSIPVCCFTHTHTKSPLILWGEPQNIECHIQIFTTVDPTLNTRSPKSIPLTVTLPCKGHVLGIISDDLLCSMPSNQWPHWPQIPVDPRYIHLSHVPGTWMRWALQWSYIFILSLFIN
jgi:hypothetical protein